MKGRRLKLAVVLGVAGASAALAGPALAITVRDSITPANTAFTATSSNVTFSATVDPVGTVTVTCASSEIDGTTPSSTTPGSELIFTLDPTAPTFSNCTDNVGGTDTVTTRPHWVLKYVDSPKAKANEKPGDDRMMLGIQQRGIAIESTAAPGCIVTASPDGVSWLGGPYDGVNTVTLNGTVPGTTSSGCPNGAESTPIQVSATYTSNVDFTDTL
jgi:hypothetical protein